MLCKSDKPSIIIIKDNNNKLRIFIDVCFTLPFRLPPSNKCPYRSSRPPPPPLPGPAPSTTLASLQQQLLQQYLAGSSGSNGLLSAADLAVFALQGRQDGSSKSRWGEK